MKRKMSSLIYLLKNLDFLLKWVSPLKFAMWIPPMCRWGGLLCIMPQFHRAPLGREAQCLYFVTLFFLVICLFPFIFLSFAFYSFPFSFFPIHILLLFFVNFYQIRYPWKLTKKSQRKSMKACCANPFVVFMCARAKFKLHLFRIPSISFQNLHRSKSQ